ncbi:MAG: hypothetical protein R2831_09790 [Chitinophagaceae bacterium]
MDAFTDLNIATRLAQMEPTRQAFFAKNKSELEHLLLQKKGIEKKSIEQLLLRLQIKDKLPLWYQSQKIYYPPSIHLQQASSWITAQYKASLFQGTSFIDLTLGMGIDTCALLQKAHKAIVIEPNIDLLKTTQHNLQVFYPDKELKFVHASADTFLKQHKESVDLIYVDPSRRNEKGQKTVFLNDYDPQIAVLLEDLFSISKRILVKTSPMLDISQAMSELSHVSEVHVVAIENECKEVLYVLQKNAQHTKIKTIHFIKDKEQVFESSKQLEHELKLSYSMPQQFLYEPNSAILKAGLFKSIAPQWALHKLHQHTHLYTSDHRWDDFPGRIFKIKAVCKANKKDLLHFIPEARANLCIRNFPSDIQTLKKKLGIQDGGKQYLFACTLHTQEKVILVCEK